MGGRDRMDGSSSSASVFPVTARCYSSHRRLMALRRPGNVRGRYVTSARACDLLFYLHHRQGVEDNIISLKWNMLYPSHARVAVINIHACLCFYLLLFSQRVSSVVQCWKLQLKEHRKLLSTITAVVTGRFEADDCVRNMTYPNRSAMVMNMVVYFVLHRSVLTPNYAHTLYFYI